MQRLRLFIFIFFLTVSLPLTYVIWQTYAGLEQEERGQFQYFSETLFDRMEKELAELIQTEENRAVDEYQHYLAPPFSQQDARQQRSPLAELPYQTYILGYLQNNPDGSFQTPLMEDPMQALTGARQDVLLQLKEANRIFNGKKFSLPSPKSTETLAADSDKLEPAAKVIAKSSISDRYLSRLKAPSEKGYLGKKQQRVEEISAGQALNIAAEGDVPQQQEQKAQDMAAPSPGRRATASADSLADEEEEQAESRHAEAALMEMAGEPGAALQPAAAQRKFQVEVAPFQSVAIKADQVYIFRRIAINNQIYRQGFILLVEPLLQHLIETHFAFQPLADYTSIRLQRQDIEAGQTVVQGGIRIDNSNFQAERTFPPPFDFLNVTLLAQNIPASPARSSLNIALFFLAAFMLLGLLAIYQSARTIVAMSERRSQFVSSVTHELKTPLTNIRMYIEMLEQGIAATPEREQEYLAVLNSESARLAGLINNVLELAKLEKKQRHFHLEEGDLSDVLPEVAVIMAEKLKQEGFSLTVKAPEVPRFYYDREVLVQILTNLIENSIKFGKYSRQKEITIAVVPQPNQLCLAVSDTGPGIPKHALNKVFDDFYRVNNDLTRSTGGTGIGLALVKKFVNALGGSVSAVNNEGPGCTISLYLPR